MESLNIESLLYLNNAVLRPWEMEEIFLNRNVISINQEKKKKEQKILYILTLLNGTNIQVTMDYKKQVYYPC